MKRYSEICFNDLMENSIGNFIKVVWNGKEVYDDTGDFLVIENHTIYGEAVTEALSKFKEKYGSKKIYSLYCRVVAFHHTELYIEGE